MGRAATSIEARAGGAETGAGSSLAGLGALPRAGPPFGEGQQGGLQVFAGARIEPRSPGAWGQRITAMSITSAPRGSVTLPRGVSAPVITSSMCSVAPAMT